MIDAILSQLANGLVLGFLYIRRGRPVGHLRAARIVNFAHGFFALRSLFRHHVTGYLGWPGVVLRHHWCRRCRCLCEIVLIKRLSEGHFSLIVTSRSHC
jgi:branched-chain amino acid transport system permease protein